MTAPVLLAVVEVPHADRVRCAAEGCGHSVFRRVHLVRTGDSTKVYGFDCFTRLFGSTPTGQAAPQYSTGTGRSLTPDERALLIENTERLIEQFEQEHQAEIAEAERRRSMLAAKPGQQTPAQTPQERHAHQLAARAAPVVATPVQRAAAEAQARQRLGEQFPGVNLDLPGFKGLVSMEVDKILRTNAA